MTNFERATRRMQSQGLRPFCPDSHTASSARWLRDGEMPREVAQHASRMDWVIVAFAAGIALGWLIGSMA